MRNITLVFSCQYFGADTAYGMRMFAFSSVMWLSRIVPECNVLELHVMRLRRVHSNLGKSTEDPDTQRPYLAFHTR